MTKLVVDCASDRFLWSEFKMLGRAESLTPLIEGRDKVIPEDVQAVLPGVATHRLRPAHAWWTSAQAMEP